MTVRDQFSLSHQQQECRDIFSTRIVWSLAACLVLAGVAGAADDAAALIPRSVLFSDATHPVAALGPRGQQMAFIRKNGNERSLWLASVNAMSDARQIRNLPGEPLQCWWNFGGDQLIVQLRAPGGAHLYALQPESAELTNLTPIRRVIAKVVRVSSDLPNHILVTLNTRKRAVHDLWQINLTNGERTLVQEMSEYRQVHVDRRFRPVVGEKMRTDQGIDLIDLRQGRGAALLKSLDRDAAHAQRVIGMDRSGSQLLYVDRTGRDKSALQSLDLDSGDVTVLAEDPDVDIHPQTVVNRYTNEVLAASCYFGDVRRFALTPEVEADFVFLKRHFSCGVGVADISADGKTWLVGPFDGGPFRYHLYQKESQQVTYLFSQFSELDGHSLANRSLHVVETRDGLRLPCHLYLSPRFDRDNDGLPDRPLPTLLYVHGGPSIAYPWDGWLTNRFLQLLADRGYASLRVEFRAADGFGKELMHKGDLQWGDEVQNDLIDIARWAKQQKIAAPGKIGIWGWSFGGYSTMAAAAFNPEEFECGMALYGVSSLEQLVTQRSDDDWRTRWRRRLGDERTPAGRAVLKRQSPIEHVADVGIPLLISCGGQDDLVPHHIQTEPFVNRLNQLGKPVTYLFYPDEPHDYQQRENWLSFWSVAERFLADHLGGDFEPYGDDLGQGSLRIECGAENVSGLAERAAMIGNQAAEDRTRDCLNKTDGNS